MAVGTVTENTTADATTQQRRYDDWCLLPRPVE